MPCCVFVFHTSGCIHLNGYPSSVTINVKSTAAAHSNAGAGGCCQGPEVDIIDTEILSWAEAVTETGQCQSVGSRQQITRSVRTIHYLSLHNEQEAVIVRNQEAAVSLKMMGADSAGRRLLFPRALPSIPVISRGKDHERKRKIAVKCLELEEMLERQG